MGVHKDRETYSHVKRHLGIPQDEPIFVIRAQDMFSLPTVVFYKKAVHDGTVIGDHDPAWEAEMDSVRTDFVTWQRDNRDKVKRPD